MEGPTFVGRARELALLRERLDAARGGDGAIVAVSGEAGIGKTRLLREFADTADSVRVAWGRGVNHRGAPPYQPWSDVLGALLTPEEQADLRTLAPDAGHALLPSASRRDIEAASIEPWDLVDLVKSVLRLRPDAPIVLIFDDLQWFDVASTRLLAEVARNLTAWPVLVVVAFRSDDAAGHELPELLQDAARARLLRRMPLAGLTSGDVPQLLADVLASPLSTSLAGLLAERTGGNPYFLRELAADIEPGGREVQALEGLPSSVRDALAPRLSVLPVELRERLAMAALLGREFSLRSWSTATGASTEALAALADECSRSGVLVEVTAGRFRFAHDLMREVALEGLSATRRALLHGTLARRLVDDDATPRTTLAWHLREGARVEPSLARPAFEHAFGAGEEARRTGAWERADRHYTDCLELLADGLGRADLDVGPERLLYLRGICRIAAGDGREAFRDLMTASEQMREQGDWAGQARAALDISRMFIPSGRAIEVLTTALHAPGAREPQLEATLVVRRARLLDVEADTEVEAARAAAPAPGPPELRAEVRSYEGRRAFLRQEYAEAVPIFAEAAALFEQLGEHAAATEERRWLHDCVLFLGDLGKTMTLFEQFIRYAGRTGRRVHEHVWLGDSGAMAILLGDFELARRRARESSPDVVYVAHSARIAVAEATDELDGIADSLPDPAQVGGARSLTGHVHMNRARALWLAGDLEAARGELAAVERYFDDDYLGHGIFNMDGVLQADGSDALVRRTYGLLQRYPAVRAAIWASADRVRGTLALRLGRLDDAEAHLRRGLEWCEASGARVESARCVVNLAEVAIARGRQQEAARLLETAIERFATLGATGYRRRASDQLAALRRSREAPHGLSAREVEILRLVSAGMTNRQIAEALVLSPNTVANHVKHILNKIGLANRAEAAAFAAKLGLTSSSNAS